MNPSQALRRLAYGSNSMRECRSNTITARSLAEYAGHLAGRDLAPSSIGKALAAITKAHVTAGHGEPDRRGAREVLRGYRKRHAQAGRAPRKRTRSPKRKDG